MKLYNVILTTAIAGGCIASAFAGGPGVKAQLEKMNKEFIASLKAKDIKWFERVAAPDFTETDMKGKSADRKTALSNMKAMFEMFTVQSCTVKLISLKEKGNSVTLVDEATMVGLMKSMDPKQKKPGVMKSVETYEEHWTKDKGQWHIHSLKSLKEKTTLNGKPFDMG